MDNCYGAKLATLGTAIAIQISSGLSADDINILGALFTVIGDQLALIAATEVSADTDSEECSNNTKTQKTN